MSRAEKIREAAASHAFQVEEQGHALRQGGDATSFALGGALFGLGSFLRGLGEVLAAQVEQDEPPPARTAWFVCREGDGAKRPREYESREAALLDCPDTGWYVEERPAD